MSVRHRIHVAIAEFHARQRYHDSPKQLLLGYLVAAEFHQETVEACKLWSSPQPKDFTLQGGKAFGLPIHIVPSLSPSAIQVV